MNQIFSALNDPTRRRILELLRKSNMTAGEIAGHFNISAPSISHHLEKLKNAGLISVARNGQFLVYSINMTVLDELLAYLLNIKNAKK